MRSVSHDAALSSFTTKPTTKFSHVASRDAQLAPACIVIRIALVVVVVQSFVEGSIIPVSPNTAYQVAQLLTSAGEYKYPSRSPLAVIVSPLVENAK